MDCWVQMKRWKIEQTLITAAWRRISGGQMIFDVDLFLGRMRIFFSLQNKSFDAYRLSKCRLNKSRNEFLGEKLKNCILQITANHWQVRFTTEAFRLFGSLLHDLVFRRARENTLMSRRKVFVDKARNAEHMKNSDQLLFSYCAQSVANKLIEGCRWCVLSRIWSSGWKLFFALKC